MLKALSVAELSNYVANIFDAEELLHNVKVYGEVSNLSNVRGNLYFVLKDEQAMLSCIMFGASQTSVKEGDQVLALGSLGYYVKGGKLNLYVQSMAPYGSGVIYQNFLNLKAKLEQEGLFDEKNKKPLPSHISTIGVITSKTGAVVHDIQTVAQRRNPTLNIVVYPAKVQGDGAEQTIVDGLKTLDQMNDVDVIVIARGGGSLEDLQPFNTEVVARQIVATKKMVISAVGHETDFTICDFASSLRAATPSEAAEIVSNNVAGEIDKMKYSLSRIFFATNTLVDEKHKLLASQMQKMHDLVLSKIFLAERSFVSKYLKLKSLDIVDTRKRDLEILTQKLHALNPDDVLSRGFVKLESVGGQVETDASKIDIGQKLQIEMKNGKLVAQVCEKKVVKNGF